jgi:regulator of replication initiation timing
MNDNPRGSPKLLHLHMRRDKLKQKLDKLNEEKASLEIELAELQETIDDENRFLDKIDFMM